MTDDDRRLSGAYAADALSDAERAAHEELLRHDPELLEETRSLSETLGELSKISATEPPARLRAEVLNRIKTVRPLPPLAPDESPEHAVRGAVPQEPVRLDRRRRRIPWIGAIAAAAAAIIVAVVTLIGQRDVGTANQAEAVMHASDVSSQSATVDDWSATLYVSPEHDKAVIASDHMPDAPAGRDFQVWLKHDDGSFTSAGVMPRTDGDGQRYVVNDVGDRIVAIAISEEPAGGSKQPTTLPILVMNVR